MSRTAGEVDKGWADYLDARPEFRKWCDYQFGMAVEANPDRFPRDEESRRLGVLSERNLVSMRRISSYYAEGILKVRHSYYRSTIAGMKDRAVLWYAINDGHTSIDSRIGKLVRSVTKQRTSFEEAKWIASEKDRTTYPILDILCAREDGLEPDSQEVGNHADIVRFFIVNQPGRPQRFFRVWHAMNTMDAVHPLWTNMDAFIGTVCRYSDYVDILRNYDYLNNKDGPIIDRKYLDTVLLGGRPGTNDISIDDWHVMTVRLLDRTDKVRSQVESAYDHLSSYLTVSRLMVRALSCFIGIGHGPDELAFMEAVYGFINGLDDRYGNALYETGTLDGTSFDILREYGPSFARPLFENQIDDWEQYDES